MDQQPYLRKTVTQRLRGFLDQTGGSSPVWATADEVIGRLWATLRARRADPAFWREFTALVEDLRHDATRDPRVGLADPSAELLGRARVEDLVAELQAALTPARDSGARRVAARARTSARPPPPPPARHEACKKIPSDTAGTEAESQRRFRPWFPRRGVEPDWRVGGAQDRLAVPTQRADDPLPSPVIRRPK